MPRKRVVDPRFFKDWELYLAEKESGFPVRLAYEGLWAVADREGRFQWKPREIQLDVLPFDDVDFAGVMEALLQRGFIRRYEAEGKVYGYIPNFKRYQPIHPREAASAIPAPPALGEPSPVLGEPKAGPVNGKDKPSPSASTSTSASTPVLVASGATNGTAKKHLRPSRDPPVGPSDWVDQAVELYAKHIGVLTHGMVGRTLKPVVARRGWDEVKQVLECFCELAPYSDYLNRVESNTLRPGEEKVKKLGYQTDLPTFVKQYTHWYQHLQVGS